MKTLRQSAEARRDSRALRPSAYRISYAVSAQPPSAQPPSAPPRNQPQSSAPAGHGATDIVELIRAACGDGSRRALRIASLDATGSIFFDGGHIVHAEFGEDYGLRALAPMLRAGPFVVEPWSGKWPSQPSFHISAELLLSMVGRDGPNAYQLDTRVIRKVDHHAVTPPPLPDPSLFAPSEGDSVPPSIPPSIPPRNTLVRAKPSRTLPTAVGSRAPQPANPAVVPAAAAVGAAASARAVAGESSSMVRVSARGALLAAHGRHADRLADAAAFIHGLANSIAVDLGGQGRAAIHLRDRSRSLFVARSEVGDVAAAFGRTRRLASVLRKVGLR